MFTKELQYLSLFGSSLKIKNTVYQGSPIKAFVFALAIALYVMNTGHSPLETEIWLEQKSWTSPL